MGPQQAKIALQFAAWIVVVATGLLFVVDRDSAEFFITAFSLAAGLIFGVVVFFLAKRS